MSISPPWIASLEDVSLGAAFALVLWAPLGRWITRRLAGEVAAGSRSICIAVGMGAWGLWILALGLVGGLYQLVVLISAAAVLAGVCFGLGAKNRTSDAQRTASYVASPTGRICIVIFRLLSVACLGVVLASSLAPETSFDALNVHLPYARDAALAHRTGFEPNNWSSVMPALPLMTYIVGFLFSGVTLAKLFNVLCYVLCGGVVYFFASRWWGRVIASAAALLFWSCPVALYEATTAMIDLPLTLYSTVAVLSFLEWAAGGEKAFLLLSGCGLGLALGCKYHAVFWVPPMVLVFSWIALRHRRLIAGSMRLMCGSIAIALLITLPWLVRAWVYTGNPVFPLANEVFKSPYFTSEMEKAARAMYANEGVGTSVSALVRLPLMVTFHPGPFRGTLGIIFFIGAMIALARAFLQRSPIGGGRSSVAELPILRYGLMCAGCYFLAWAFTAQEVRYLLPIVPLLAILSAAGILRDAPAASARSRITTTLGILIIVGGSVTAFPPIYPLVVREWTYWHAFQSPISYLLGRQSAEEYLQRDVPSIYVYDYINRHLTGRDRVLLLNDANQFYSRVPTLYSFTVEGERILLQETESSVIARLKESGISHVLLNYNGIAPLPGVAPRLGAYFFLEKGFQERNLKAVYSKNNVILYQVRTS